MGDRTVGEKKREREGRERGLKQFPGEDREPGEGSALQRSANSTGEAYSSHPPETTKKMEGKKEQHEEIALGKKNFRKEKDEMAPDLPRRTLGELQRGLYCSKARRSPNFTGQKKRGLKRG